MNNHNNSTFLIHGPNQSGLVAVITDFIKIDGGNIIELDQNVAHQQIVFFMRIKWDLSKFLIPYEKISDYFQNMYVNKYGMTIRPNIDKYVPRNAVSYLRCHSHYLFNILGRYIAGECKVEIH